MVSKIQGKQNKEAALFYSIWCHMNDLAFKQAQPNIEKAVYQEDHCS